MSELLKRFIDENETVILQLIKDQAASGEGMQKRVNNMALSVMSNITVTKGNYEIDDKFIWIKTPEKNELISLSRIKNAYPQLADSSIKSNG